MSARLAFDTFICPDWTYTSIVILKQVLEVHEQLEQPIHEIQEDEDLDDTEKAIVREMCNVSTKWFLYAC